MKPDYKTINALTAALIDILSTDEPEYLPNGSKSNNWQADSVRVISSRLLSAANAKGARYTGNNNET